MVLRAGGRPNQGVVLECSPLLLLPEPDVTLDEAGAGADTLGGQDDRAVVPLVPPPLLPPVWLAMDQVQDPMNMGSILRTALFYGVRRVLWEKVPYLWPAIPVFQVVSTMQYVWRKLDLI